MARLLWQGLDKFCKDKQLARFIQDHYPDMSTLSICKPHNKPFAFLLFSDEEARAHFVESSADLKFKDQKLRLKVIENEDRSTQHYQTIAEVLAVRVARMQGERTEPVGTLEDQVTPLWQTPYPQQLVMKRNIVFEAFRAMLKTAKTTITKEMSPEPSWVTNPLSIPEPIPSPITDAYRNKVEFTIAAAENGIIEVGFIHGKMDNASIRVGSSENCVNISDAAKAVARKLGEVLTAGSVPAYDSSNHSGAWRTATYRSSEKTRESLLVLEAEQHPDLFSLKDALLAGFPEITSICISIRNGQFHILKGSGYYHEQILNKTFRISAKSFFQVNTPACEVLYTKVRDLVEGDVLLDVCCGTGTIGICCAEKVKRVIGLELVEEAVVDARFNAAANNVTAEYIVGRAENAIKTIAQQLEGQRTIGIVDPPRAGLHKTILTVLRTTKGLDRLVYVSCNPESMCNDLLQLCLPVTHKRRGPAFVPQSIQLVDLFPHTPHVESIVHLERIY
jgi:tRNA (uracil-5-)-methyltransferase